MTDQELEQLLRHPFEEREEATVEQSSMLNEDAESFLGALTGLSDPAAIARQRALQETPEHEQFLRPIELVQRPHISSASTVYERLFSREVPEEAQKSIEPYAEEIKKTLDELRKSYRVYVETAADDILEKEADRLMRKYFPEQSGDNQKRFIKLKRFYEKIRTFNDRATTAWNTLYRIIDTFSVMHETRRIVRGIQADYLEGVHNLIRETDAFLSALRLYAGIKEEIHDNVTGSYRVEMDFSPEVHYTIRAMIGEMQNREAENQDSQKDSYDTATEDESDHISVAKSIILETRERKFNKNSRYSVPILGSRDWNRSQDYALEIPVHEYREAIDKFESAFFVSTAPNMQPPALSVATAQLTKGSGKDELETYLEMIERLLNKESSAITREDIPGLSQPDVFLYHAGPQCLYRILTLTLRADNYGDVYFLDESRVIQREYPEQIIKKVMIQWWTERFRNISAELVDSYLTYSRSLDMVKKEFRSLYEKGIMLRKREQPQASYLDLNKWMHDNRIRVFGLRKYELFKRFLEGTMAEMI